MVEAVIVDAVRTPIGRAFKGSLRSMRADELAAVPLRALIDRNPGVDFAATDDVMMGAASASGEQSYNVGRNALLLAGIEETVPGCTVNRFCASSLQTLRMAFHAIAAGEGEQYIAAGVESVSRAAAGAAPDGASLNARLDGSPGSICDVYVPMGRTAENVAERFSVSREDQDQWAVISQDRAVSAQRSGHYDSEIVAVRAPAYSEDDGEGGAVEVAEALVTTDDGPRPGTTMEVLAALEPAFIAGGTVTAGNSCPLNDGAAAVLVMSAPRAERLGLQPLARIVASAVAAVEPEYMGVGPIPAIRQLLERASLPIDDVDIVEINEAFAAQVVACMRRLGIAEAQLNPFGGAIALGHPFGMTGARIMTTLLNGLEKTGGRYGIDAMCVAGGMGQAMLIERL
ncbi:MAG TPA: acetyl-CoA C-acyltransferase [Solirubrobacteraceae bacterium]|jgi:acetyl-CoA C-acetyltransferase|nr:acetyl-CoA C-acyltransferase [Solirubrobacteraceae bacterium]